MTHAPIHIGELVIDLAKHRVMRGGKPIHLTRIEWALLRELATHPGEVQGHRQLLQRVWGEMYNDESEYVHTYMRRLRRKLELEPSVPTFLLTESGIGYRFEPPEYESPPIETRPTHRTTSSHKQVPVLINALPLDLEDRFVGREYALAALRRLLRERVRLIGIYGRAGMGKTALASVALREWLDMKAAPTDAKRMRGVVVLSTSTTPITLRRVLTDARKLIPQTDAEIEAVWNEAQTPLQRATALLGWLQRGEFILFLDNLDAIQHPVTGELLDADLSAFIEAVVSQGGAVHVVVTSREPLMLPRVLRTWERTILLTDGLTDAEGAELLRRSDPDGAARLHDAPDADLMALSAYAGGIPSALDTLVGWMIENPLLTPAQILADEALFSSEIEMPLSAAAYQRLDTDAQRVMGAAALFERPFTLDALAAVMGSTVHQERLSALVGRLVRNFFLRYDRPTSTFSVPPSDRAFALTLIPAESKDGFDRSTLTARIADYALARTALWTDSDTDDVY